MTMDPADLALAHRVLRAGIRLMRSGHGRLALLPGLAGDGAWRCDFHVQEHPSRVAFRFRSPRTARCMARCGDGLGRARMLRPDIEVAALANTVLAAMSDSLSLQCRGDLEPEEALWVDRLECLLDKTPGLPIAHDDRQGEPAFAWRWRAIGHAADRDLALDPPPHAVPRGGELFPTKTAFWKGYYRPWHDLCNGHNIGVSPDDKTWNAEFAEIAHRTWHAMREVSADQAYAMFKVAFKSALVALQPLRHVEPAMVLLALRDAGLVPRIVPEEDGREVVLLELPSDDLTGDAEGDSVERLRRVFIAMQAMGQGENTSIYANLNALCRGGLVDAMKAERQDERASAKALAMQFIAKAKG